MKQKSAPVTDESISRAYKAVRDGGAGLIDLSKRGRILVSGSEAVMFLNGLITNDMKTLDANSWMTAAFPNVQGRLLAVVRILHRLDGFLLDTEQATRQKVVHLLDRFTLAGDFRVTDVSELTSMFSLQGRQAADIVRTTFGEGAAGTERHCISVAQLGSADVTLIRATHTAEDGFDLLVSAQDSGELHQALSKAGALLVDDETTEILRIEAGIPTYGVDMDESTVVTETNLDDAVSFTKGCYLGQEIIVRIKHRGHVAKRLTGIICEGHADIEGGVKILSIDDKEIGRVTSSAFSPELNRTIALGYVKYDYLTPGTKVKVSNEISAEVAQLPFVRGTWTAEQGSFGT